MPEDTPIHPDPAEKTADCSSLADRRSEHSSSEEVADRRSEPESEQTAERSLKEMADRRSSSTADRRSKELADGRSEHSSSEQVADRRSERSSRSSSRSERYTNLGFLPYQVDWLLDTSRFKIGLWARQTGKDYTCAFEAVVDCLENPKTHWLIVACGERQALETLEKAREWTTRLQGNSDYSETRDGGGEALMRKADIRFPNGSRITAVPAKPETLRGYSANLILTEFAFHEKPEEIWRAVFPSISNPLRGGEKKIRIITTPNGQGTLFHKLWLDAPFSKHKVTIHEAVDRGLRINIEELRAALADSDGWAQEYECEFLDQASVLLPYDLITECESAEATETATPDHLSRAEGELFAGIDFGRKQDLTVCWILERLGEELWTREVLVLSKMPTPQQLEMLAPRLRLVQRVSLDYTGAGVGLGDELIRRFGGFDPNRHGYGKIELCHFTSSFKCELFPRLRAEMERGQVRIPVSRAIREDLHSMHKVITSAGGIVYRATHTADGHSDRCTALALAVRAAGLLQGSERADLLDLERPSTPPLGRMR